MSRAAATCTGVDTDKVRKWIDVGLYTSETAHDAGLIDAVQQRQEFEAGVKQRFDGKMRFTYRYGEKARLKLDLSSLTKALVSGGALFPALRQAYRARGIATLQCYATAELGLIAYESAAADGSPNPGLIVDEQIIVDLPVPASAPTTV